MPGWLIAIAIVAGVVVALVAFVIYGLGLVVKALDEDQREQGLSLHD